MASRDLSYLCPLRRRNALHVSKSRVPDAQEMSQRIRDILTKYPYFVAELDGTVVGYAYATAFRTRTRIAGVWS